MNNLLTPLRDTADNVSVALTCCHLSDVYEVILRGRRQHLPIMTEAQCPHRPVQPMTHQVMINWSAMSHFIMSRYSPIYRQMPFNHKTHRHTYRLTWRSSAHTPVHPRPTDWRGRRHFLWRSISPWDRTWCRCSWMGERWWTGWASALDNCKQTQYSFQSEPNQYTILYRADSRDSAQVTVI